MEIGSFIELDLRKSGELYTSETGIARLNTARASIFHAMRILGFRKIYLPHYLCSVVRDFLTRKGVQIFYYNISENFEPLIQSNEDDTAILIVNYYGIMSMAQMNLICKRFKNIIIDNSAAFFSSPLADCSNVYSTRKFFGVPDGSYLIGHNAELLINDYHQDYSSPTSLFLLKRIEYGSQAVYNERMQNEERLNKSDVLKMSPLTRALLSGIDYTSIKNKRKENFLYAQDLFGSSNLLTPALTLDKDIWPMIYPLLIEDCDLVEKLKLQGIYTGRWWKHVLYEVPADSFEALLSNFMLPIPIDQRYGKEELLKIQKVIFN